MIGKISGKLIERHPPQVLVDVHGVGYEIDVPMSTFYQLPANGSEVTLYTHLIVREDAHQLYGFASEQERHVFRQLLKISGVGARTALSVLSGMSVSDLYEAVSAQDSGRLVRVPGIGKKTAERLLLELKDKLDVIVVSTAATAAAGASSDILNALLALGYNDKEAQWAIRQLPGSTAVTEGIRQALKLLSKQ
ncbi:MAG: Holliday junction branch migration protein RuvA [Betaproteobacteria bacterium]|nr:Holliday junction branch migration protein RuvA [Betaproteobacteria bacterium]MBI3054949.1 Holliday junction branch migration protein RuvA [Betaproteobacteria bacterium]